MGWLHRPGDQKYSSRRITAKVDMRLVTNMTIGEVLPMIRRHLDRDGFLEVKIRVLEAGYSWTKNKVSNPTVQALMRMYRELGHEPEIRPYIARRAPFAMFPQFTVRGQQTRARWPSAFAQRVMGEDEVTHGLATLEKSCVVLLENPAKAL
jgi:hypothetical protein